MVGGGGGVQRRGLGSNEGGRRHGRKLRGRDRALKKIKASK